MARGSALDPQWVNVAIDNAPLENNSTKARSLKVAVKVAVFKRHAAYDADASVVAAIEQAASWLAKAGCDVEEAEPPNFEEGANLWNQMVMDDMRRSGQPAIEAMADAGTQAALRGYLARLASSSRDQTFEHQMRRFSILRDWAVFFEKYPVLLMPNSWQRQFPINADTLGDAAVQQILAAQSPLLGTAMMGLPGLSVPTGMGAGLPTGVQLVSWKFREDLILQAGELIESAAGFSALDTLLH